MKALTSFLYKEVFRSNYLVRWSIRTLLLVTSLWVIALWLLNRDVSVFVWFITNVETLRTMLASIFQGLAAFLAIVVSVSLLVTQLAYGSLSPRLLPNFLKNKFFISVIVLFIGSLALNLILLSQLSEQTVHNLIPLLVLDFLISTIAIILVIPATLLLLKSAHPMQVGWELVERFDKKYFGEIPFNTEKSPTDEVLPLLQTLFVKALRDADTDYAQRLLGSFEDKLIKNLNDDNAVLFAGYFEGFFRKIIFVASQENEENVLQQIVFSNEALEKKAVESKKYLTNADTRYEASFAKNILYIIDLSIEREHTQVLWKALGSMYRLREEVMKYTPTDDEIAIFRTIKHFRGKEKEEEDELKNESVHYANERAFEYIKGTFFDSNFSMAFKALGLHNQDATHHFVREVFRTRYQLDKLDKSKYKEVIKRIAYSDLYNLTRLSRLSVKNNVSISEEVAVGVQEARDFFVQIDEKLAESYVDLLGQLMIDTTEREIPSSDPNATFFWAGVALRMLLSRVPPKVPIKLIEYFEKVLNIIKERQKLSSSPLLEEMKETICREIASVKKYDDADKSIHDKAGEVLAQHPDVEVKE